MFETGDYPFWYNKCLPNKQWSHPQKLPNCMRRFFLTYTKNPFFYENTNHDRI